MNKQEAITRLEETLDELTASVFELSGDELNWLSGERAYTNAVNRVRTLALKAAHGYSDRGEPTPQHVESAIVFMPGEEDVARAFAESQARVLSRGMIFVEDEPPLTGMGGSEFLVANNDQDSFPTDSELLRAIKTGDEPTQRNAAGKLVEKHTKSLKNSTVAHLQRKNCNEPAVHVKEVLSDTWISVFGHLDDLHDREKFAGWLITIARNEANRHLRLCIGGQVSSVQITEGFMYPPAQLRDYYHSRDAAIDADRMLSYACRISEEFGSIFRLRIEALGFDEIAHRLGKNQEAIRTQYYRGIQKLRARFKKPATNAC